MGPGTHRSSKHRQHSSPESPAKIQVPTPATTAALRGDLPIIPREFSTEQSAATPVRATTVGAGTEWIRAVRTFTNLWFATRILASVPKIAAISTLTFGVVAINAASIGYSGALHAIADVLKNVSLLQIGLATLGVSIAHIGTMEFLMFKSRKLGARIFGNGLYESNQRRVAEREICGACDYERAPRANVCSECGTDTFWIKNRLEKFPGDNLFLRWLFAHPMDDFAPKISHLIDRLLKPNGPPRI